MDRIKVRAANKRRGPDLTRNWVVSEQVHEWRSVGRREDQISAYVGVEHIYTCQSFDKAITVAYQIAQGEVVDCRNVMALSKRSVR